jgi:hypothetical protein
MKHIISVAVFLSVYANVHAGVSSALQHLDEQVSAVLKTPAALPVVGSPAKLETSETIIPDPTIPEYPYEDLCFGGALTFSAGGRDFSVKLGFEKGHYDDYVKTYKPKRVIFTGYILHNAERPHDCMPITMDILDKVNGEYADEYTFEKEKMIFSAVGGNLSVTLKNKVDGSSSEVAYFSYADMLNAWKKHAEKFAVNYNGKKLYVIPQGYVHDDARGIPFGFILSEGNPLYYATGLPLDYVELLRAQPWDGTVSYKPVGYSIPLGIALEKRPGNGWGIRDITSEEIYAALNDEAMDTAQ